MESLLVPGLTALRSTDARVIRQIVMSLVNEIEGLNQRISSLENNAQTPTKKEKYYGV